MSDLILASGSPQRAALMRRIGPCRTVAPRVPETYPPGLPVETVAVRLARRKARAVARDLTKGRVIGADTLVALGDEILGKPADRAEAAAILSRLSGTRHAVITGVCVVDAATGRERTAAETTWVTMRRLSPAEIAAYVAGGEAEGKAGAYAIQETGDRYVERVEGDFDNVVGLPVALVKRLLRDIASETA